MAFDGIVTKSIVAELQRLIGSKIEKIYQPDRNTVTLALYLQGKKSILNICIESHNCRLNITKHPKENPAVAPDFCMLLRKHLMGGKISEISMIGIERLVKIQIEIMNEFSEIETKTLIIELMGKHSNIILTKSDGTIVDSMRRISYKNSYREILPSRTYELPKSDKIDFTKLKSSDDFCDKVLQGDELKNKEELAQAIANKFTGISLTFSKSVIDKCGINSEFSCLDITRQELEKCYNYISKIVKGKCNLKFELIYKNGKISDYVLILANDSQNDDLNFLIDDFYFERETNEAFVNYRNTILKMILEHLKKYNKHLCSIDSKLKECDEMDKYKLYGELITANLYRLADTHSSTIKLENYYDNNNLISIPLDIRYSPSVNAKRYFKKYSKLKNAFQIVTNQKIETEKEIDYIGSIVYELENSTCLEDVQDIFEEISENVVFKDRLKKKDKKKNSKKKKQKTFSPIEYDIDGYKIYVGRNNIENDWLTFSFADKSDIWFHVKDIQR